MSDGAWIFLSHSNKDFDRVTPLRNALESEGHHPLLFFLKCLDDAAEIDGLIRREIEARSWFILCDSRNARVSRWVQDEIRIIKSLPGDRTYVEVDLENALSDQLQNVHDLTLRASVFLSYSHHDQAIASRLEAALRSEDFGVFSPIDLEAGENWEARIGSELGNAVRKGAVLFLLSRAALASEWVRSELRYALREMRSRGRSSLVPVFVESPGEVMQFADPYLRDAMETTQWVDLSRGFEDQMGSLMRGLRALAFRSR